jgi:predicted Zn-dependent protease with MMP-like domain
MTEASNRASFEKIVEWAYGTLPEKVRDLPDFPGIQVVDEPPKEMLEAMSKRGNWPQNTDLLGCYSGISRIKRQHNSVQIAPNLIFIFRGPILRRSKGNLPTEVKQVVWHEVAHWLGYDERQVKELGLSGSFKDIACGPLESNALTAGLQQRLPDAIEKEDEADQQLRCLKCYSTDVVCREVGKTLTPSGAWLTDPVLVHAKICKCGSCGYEWDDEDSR